MRHNSTVQFKFVEPGLLDHEKQMLTPRLQSQWASGFDLASVHRETLKLGPKERLLVRTGIAIALPNDCEGQVRSRSGLALKHGVIVLNSPGTIDADYRGEIKVILQNTSDEDFLITFGMRIAQLVIAEVLRPTMQEAMLLDESNRGDGGFGSTGFGCSEKPL